MVFLRGNRACGRPVDGALNGQSAPSPGSGAEQTPSAGRTQLAVWQRTSAGCTTATRPSAPDTSCLSAAAARGALRWQLGPRRDCRLRTCGCGVLLARGGADSSPPCTGAGVGELKRATAAVSSPAAPCCRQLCLAPHAQVSGLSALTAGGTSLPTSAECFHTGSRLGGGPARCGGRRGDVFGIKNHPVCHQQPPPACHSRLVGFRYSALYPWGVFGMAEWRVALKTMCGATPDGRRCGAVRSPPPRRVSANAPRAACAFALFGCRWRRTSHPRCPRRRADAARPPSPSPSTRQGRQQQEQQQHAAGELPHCGPRAGADSGGCSQQPGGRCGAARCHSGRCRLACLASARLVDAAADRPCRLRLSACR